jgi:hypothetical protein
MNSQSSTDFASRNMEHLEDEFNALEGVSRWAKPIRIGVLVLVVAAIAGGVVWYAKSPTVVTYKPAYSSATPMDILEPMGALSASPVRFSWEKVTGRLQYVIRVYRKGSTNPVFETMTTASSIELASDDQARMPRGAYTWKVTTQGQNGATIAEGNGAFKVR